MDMIKSLSSKPKKFIGEKFYYWQQQVKVWLTKLSLISVIFYSKNEKKISTSSKKVVQIDDALTITSTKEDVIDKNILCHGHILSALFDNIYKVYCHTKTVVELQEALELKYGFVEKHIKRYSCERMIEFQMVDGKPILNQIHEFENIVYDMNLKGIALPDIMLVTLMISKLPSS